ncbi:hypothetical protein R4Z10_02640 [Niallia sp. XMNu-256]|uniref:hypothetical protein n=1 Tax=Niallia sp. XMNu-256 TaxID=3082444 RepID=UPI0030D0656C
MKRYWKLIILSLVTVVVIGTFYTQASLANKAGINIEFEKITGNEEELKDLMIYGDYSIGHMYQPLQITTEGTVNPYDRSFIEQLSPANSSPIFKDWIKDHKKFMRGKDLIPSNFFENESILVYASFKGNFHDYPKQNIAFDIDILNKNSGETFSIQTDVPFLEKYDWMNIEDVQLVDNELKLLVRGFGMEGGNDLKVYTFDVKEQQIVGNDTIVSLETASNSWTEMVIINELHNSITSQKYYVIKLETFEAEEVQSDGFTSSTEGEPKTIANEVLLYNIENDEVKQWAIPDEMKALLDMSIISQSSIYTYMQLDEGIEVSQYDLEKEKWIGKQTFHLKQSIDNENPPFIKIMSGKIYMISATDDGHTLLIGDLNTGKSLYEGKLVVKNKKENQQGYRLYFNEIDSL